MELQKEKSEKGIDNLFKEIIAENHLNLEEFLTR